MSLALSMDQPAHEIRLCRDIFLRLLLEGTTFGDPEANDDG